MENTCSPATSNTATIRVAIERVAHDGSNRVPVKIRFADSQVKRPRYANGFEILGIHSAWLVPNGTQRVESIWSFEEAVSCSLDEQLIITMTGVPKSRLALGITTFVPTFGEGMPRYIDETAVDFLAKWGGRNDDEQDVSSAFPVPDSVARQWLYLDGLSLRDTARAAMRNLEREIVECRDGRWPVMITERQSPRATRVLPRGNWQDLSGPVVFPATPSFLPPEVQVASQDLTRMDLAKWLVGSDNPLTARVQVNRWWQHFFGNGLSAVLDDLGLQGEYPSHPELLDWLACEFRDQGWDTKRLMRMIVTSATYRQSSAPSPAAMEVDPDNRLLSHQNARRLGAETIRDNALAIAGLLNLEMGGPPVFPYQPENYYAHLQFPDRRYRTNTDERQYRRGVYMHWQRAFLHPMLANFDAPSREECTGMRLEANTPQQALNLLNDPSLVEAAKGLALAIWECPTDEARIRAAFERAVCRPPSVPELKSMLAFVEQQRAHWNEHPDDAAQFLAIGLLPIPLEIRVPELASWMSVARVILNLHETITRY